MALRNSFPDDLSTFPDPIFGVNLNKAIQDLQRGEAREMCNLIFDGGTTTRLGSSRLTPTQEAASLKVRGGHKFYQPGAKSRLIAYGTKISTVSDGGSVTELATDQTNDKDTHFTTWSITEKVYINNGTDAMAEYDNSTFQRVHVVGDTNIRTGTFTWTASGSGTSEFYLVDGGGDPGLAEPTVVLGDDIKFTKSTLGSLATSQWGFGDNDTLGFSTIYVRLADNADPDSKADGFVVARYSANVPGDTGNPAATLVTPILDRLFAITSNGIERTDARVANIWSKDSTWATFRPSLVGNFTALIPHTLQSITGDLIPGGIAFQANAYYFIAGTDFGDDVTAASPNASEDGSIKLMNPDVGTSSPYSVVSVAGLGLFWFTTDLNVYYLPFGSGVGRKIGYNIFSTGDVNGIENTNVAALDQVWMIHCQDRLMLAIPTGSNTYASTQFWLDLKSFVQHPDRGPVWYGPMNGQSVGRAWVELEDGDNFCYGGEGDTTEGIFVYQLLASATYTDAVGLADNNIATIYSSFINDFEHPSREKYVHTVELLTNSYTGDATMDLFDLTGDIVTDLAIVDAEA